jgi:hypothetical protein
MPVVLGGGVMLRHVSASVIALAVPGCGTHEDCSGGIVEARPVITVTDATTGDRICDATVIVVEDAGGAALTDAGGATNALMSTTLGGVPCYYDGSALDPLDQSTTTFTIRVSKAGYETTTASNVVTKVEQCSSSSAPLTAQAVNVALQPG